MTELQLQSLYSSKYRNCFLLTLPDELATPKDGTGRGPWFWPLCTGQQCVQMHRGEHSPPWKKMVPWVASAFWRSFRRKVAPHHPPYSLCQNGKIWSQISLALSQEIEQRWHVRRKEQVEWVLCHNLHTCLLAVWREDLFPFFAGSH